MQPIETRDKIIEQCFHLLLIKGYDGVSISDIQSSLGISRGLLYHYFGSKEALFIEATKCHFTKAFQLEFSLIASYNIDQMLEYIVDSYRKFINETLQGVSIINYDFLCYRALQESAELAMLYQRVRDDELRGWLVALGNSRDQGLLHDGIDLQRVAQNYIYTVDGVWLKAVTPLMKIDLVSALRLALETLNVLIKK